MVKGGQVLALQSNRGVRMDNKALLGNEALCRHALSLSALGWDWRAGCLERRPGRFGRGWLDSLHQKRLAAYLINVS
jgi:hypothetical protein